jgi:hypothetical protein
MTNDLPGPPGHPACLAVDTALGRYDSIHGNAQLVQRAELEEADPAVLLDKLRCAGPGRGASVIGFRCGEIPRGIVEDFLAGRDRRDRDAR